VPRAVLIDLDGVLYEGDRAVPGAADAVAWLRRQGIPHLFLTNTTSRPRSALVEKLAGLGVEASEDDLHTPPVAARAWIARRAPGPCALFVPEATAAEFEGVEGLEPLPPDAERGAASVVLGDLGEGWSFARLNRAFRLCMDEPRPALVALGATRYWRAPDGLRLDVGAYTAALERASGLEARVLGKPAPSFFEAALQRVGAAAAETVMIGDDVVGDVGGARRAGLRGLLVRTGKFRPADLEGDVRPDAVLDSLADLPAWWTQS